MVDLGGSTGDADIFKGSDTSENDVLDARVAHDLEFADGWTATSNYFKSGMVKLMQNFQMLTTLWLEIGLRVKKQLKPILMLMILLRVT